MTPALWLVVAVVVSFCAWTLAVFLLPDDTSDEPCDPHDPGQKRSGW